LRSSAAGMSSLISALSTSPGHPMAHNNRMRFETNAALATNISHPAYLRTLTTPVLTEFRLIDMLKRFRQPQVRYRPGFARY